MTAFTPRARLLGCVAVLLLVALAAPSPSWGTRATDMRWRSFETNHFDVHYYEGEELLAERVARIVEQARAELSPVFGYELSDRAQIVVTDHLDAANGLASTIPYDRIEVYAYPPEPDGELGSYDDYLHVLLFHEYVHLLHLNTVGAVPWFVNTVVGKRWLPNTALPKWYTEGIAVLVESRVTGRGRVGSSRTRMILRAAALDGGMLTLPELTDGPLKRPRSSGFYLYGGEFLTFVADKVGLDKLIAFQHAYGRRLIPFSLNLLAKRHLGFTFMELYDEWYAEATARAQRIAAEVDARGHVAGTPLTTSAEEHNTPRLSPDGRLLAFIENDGHRRQNIRLVGMDDGRDRGVVECDGYCSELSWSPDGRTIVFNRYQFYRTVYYYRELFEVEVATGRVRQLTRGQRVRELDVAPSGREVAWITTKAGQTALVAWERDSEAMRTIVPYRAFDQLATPRWSPDGTRIAYTAWVEGDGRRDLYVVDADGSGAPRRFTWDEAQDLDVCWSPDGAYLLFAADPDGIFNIYALRLADGQRFRVTNVRTGAFRPDIDRGGRHIVFQHYGARGYDVHRLPYRPESWTPVSPAAPAPPAHAPYEPPETETTEPSGYNPFWTLRPFRIEPTWVLDQNGLGNVGVQLSGTDALNHHYWLAALDYSILHQRLSELLVYTNRMLPVDLGFTFAHLTWERSAFFNDRLIPYEERVLNGSVDVAVPFPDTESGFWVGMGYTFRWSTDIDRPELEWDPGDLVPFVPSDGLLSGAYLAWSYSNTKKVLYGIDAHEGRSVSLRLSLNHPALGSDFKTIAFTWHWREHLAAPWGHHHVFMLQLKGGISAGHPEFRPGFSIGGIPPQELFVSIVEQQQLGGTHLRGYAQSAFSGDQYYLLTAEFRFPILELFRGLETLPVWASRLTGAVFCDAGNAFSGPIGEALPKVGIGAELRFHTVLFYSFAASFRLGYARGLAREGEHQFYFILGSRP